MPTNSVVNKYSKNEIKQMPIIAGIGLYDILRDYNGLDEKKKSALFRKVNDFSIMRMAPHVIETDYKNIYPDFAAKFQGTAGDEIAARERYINMYQENKRPSSNYYVNTNPDNTVYFSDAFEAPIKGMLDGMKELSGHLDKYMKTAPLLDSERKFLEAYKFLIDDYAFDRGHMDKISKNPAYNFAESFIGAMLRFETHNFKLVYDEKTGEQRVDTEGRDFDANWQNTVASIEGPMLDSITKAIDLQKKIEAYDKGDASRDELISMYEDYAETIGKVVNMPEDDFKKIHGQGQLLNNYDNFVSGSRTPHYVYYEAQAKAQLLKTGYSLEDANELAQFFVFMEGANRRTGLLGENKQTPKMKEQYEKMSSVWKQITEGTITPDLRKTNLNAVHECVNSLINEASDKALEDSSFSDAKGLKDILTNIDKRKNLEMSADEKVYLTANRKELYEAIKEVDSSFIRSSEAFRTMKSDLEKLAGVNRKEFPEKYELLKKNAIKSMEAYLDYKHKQLNDPKNSHSRSEYELNRVKRVNAVLGRLKELDREDFKREQLNDKRFVVNDELSYKNARAFIKAGWVMEKGRKEFLRELASWKNALINSQGLENKDKNFENTEEMVGSDSYKALTQALQKCIENFENPNASPAEIQKSLAELSLRGRQYHESHKGLIFDPQTAYGQIRFETSDQIQKSVPVMLVTFDNMRRQFEPVKDENDISYMHKPYSEIEANVNNYVELHREQMLKDPRIPFEKIYDNMYEVSKMQISLKEKVREKNGFMVSNYKTDYKPDHYLAVKEGMSVDELAKNYVTLQYLNRMYKVGIKPDALNEIEKELNNGKFDKEVAELAKNPVFKAVAREYPGRCFTKWSMIEKKAYKIQKMCDDNINDMFNSRQGEPYEALEDYVIAKMGSGDGTGISPSDAAGKVMANNLIRSDSGRIIAQAIAADVSLKPEDAIRQMEQKAGEYIRQNTKRNPAHLLMDPEFNVKIQKHLMGAGNNKLKANAEASRRAKRDAMLNKKQVKNKAPKRA